MEKERRLPKNLRSLTVIESESATLTWLRQKTRLKTLSAENSVKNSVVIPIGNQLGDIFDRIHSGIHCGVRSRVEIFRIVGNVVHKDRHQNFLPIQEFE